MIKYYYLLFFVLIITYSCTFEGGKERTSQTEQDSLYIASLVDKAKVAVFQSPDSTKIIADEMLAFSKRQKYKLGMAHGYITLGTYYSFIANYEDAIKHSKKALILSQGLQDKKLESTIYNHLGNIYSKQSNLDLALEAHLKSLKTKEELNDLRGKAFAHNSISIIHHRIGDFEKALEHVQIAYSITNENNFEVEKMQIAFQVAAVMFELNKEPLALTYADTCIACAQRLNIEMGIYRAKELKASIYAERGNSQEFGITGSKNKQYVQQALKIYREVGDYYKREKLEADILQNNINQVNLLIHLKQEFSEIERLSYQNLAIALKAGDKRNIVYSYKHLAYIKRQLNQFDSSYIYLEHSYNYQDSITGLEKDKEIKNIEAKYETEKKVLQIEKLSQEKEQRSIMFSGVVIGFILLVLVLIFFFRQKRLQSQYLALDSEQKFLRTQMNPHFIFNALTAIQYYVLKNEAKKSVFYISTFAKLMRQVLNNSQDNFVGLEEEIDTLKNYLELQKVRFQDKFDYQVEIDPNLEIDELAIPPMFAQPFIENSLEHGIKHKEEKGNIRIKFYQKDKKYLVFEVEDDGIGLDKSQVINAQNEKKHQSMATKITKNRIALLNKRFDLDVKFDISPILNEENNIQIGTKVWFLLPFKYL